MNESSKNLWWGYLHTNGNIQAKRYWDLQDIAEAQVSPFCALTTGPFEASCREEALAIVAKEVADARAEEERRRKVAFSGWAL